MVKDMKKKWLVCILLLTFMTVFTTKKTFAEKEKLLIPYDITANIPKNQIDKKVSYFDVLVKPGEKQEFSLKVRNTSNKTIKVKITPNTARTTLTGVVDYSGKEYPLTDSIPASFEKVISEKQTITLKPNEQKDVVFTMDMPKKSFKGVLLGGFYIQEVKEEEKAKKEDDKGTGIAINNVFSTTVGAMVRNSTNEVSEDFSLDNVEIDNHSGYFSLVTELANNAAKINKDLSYEGTITDKNGKKIDTIKKERFDMAPNSVFKNPEKVNVNDFVTGKYTMNLTVYNKDKTKHWDLKKEFSITRKERNTVIKETGVEVNNNWNKWIVIAAICIILLLVLIIVLLVRKNKRTA